MAIAIAFIFYQPDWVKAHPVIGKDISFLRVLAISALIGIPLVLELKSPRSVGPAATCSLPNTSFPKSMRCSATTATASA